MTLHIKALHFLHNLDSILGIDPRRREIRVPGWAGAMTQGRYYFLREERSNRRLTLFYPAAVTDPEEVSEILRVEMNGVEEFFKEAPQWMSINGLIHRAIWEDYQRQKANPHAPTLVTESYFLHAEVRDLVHALLDLHTYRGANPFSLKDREALDMLGTAMLSSSDEVNLLALLIFQEKAPQLPWWIENFKRRSAVSYEDLSSMLEAQNG